MRTRKLDLTLLAVLLLAGCGQPTGGHPTFAVGLAADGPSSDEIQVIEDIGTNAEVRGRFHEGLQYRGFTFQAEAGQQLEIQMDAQRVQGNMVLDQEVDTQLLLYAPSEGLFTEVIQETPLESQAAMQVTVEQTGTYLLAAARQEAVQQAQFQLQVDCPQCQEPPQPDLLCEPGRLFVEGYHLGSQEWRQCEVVLLEPVEVGAEETLKIGPDVHVRAHYYITDYHAEGFGETRLVVAGQLQMESDAEHPIVFESNVPDKQWDGLIMQQDGTELHDFVLRDTHSGLRIEASDVSVRDALFELNGTALALSSGVQHSIEPASLSVSGCTFRENTVGLAATPQRRDAVGLLVENSEFTLNHTGINVVRGRHAQLRALEVHDNATGISAANSGNETSSPEDYLVIEDLIVRDNVRGIDIGGNALVSNVQIIGNGDFGLRTNGGWQRFRNSLVTDNGHSCQFESYWQDAARCAGVIVEPETHTVIRNDIIQDNGGHGIVLRGVVTTQTTRVDPSVLNSEISGNTRGGILLLDAPLCSIEYNTLEGNGLREVTLGYSNVTARNNVCTTTYRNNDGSRIAQISCLVRSNRIQHNNFYPEDKAVAYGDNNLNLNSDYTPKFQLDRGVLVISQNYFDDLSTEEIENSLGADVIRERNLELLPLLDEPESMAGLIVPLDFD